MFLIEDGRSQFYQWDLNRRLIIEDQEITQVHFCNRTDECSLVCDAYTENGIRLVDVPNVLLQTNWRINVYAFDKEYTKHNAVFTVVARTKPADYVYTETEVHTWNELNEKIEAVGDVSAAVEDYLEQNPVEVDLSNYYDKAAVDAKIETIELTPGKDGEPGKDGYTPIKGIDYFDGAPGEPGEDGYTPIKGVDYFDGAPGEDGKDGYTPVKGVDYFDGKDGEPGKDGSDYVLTAEDKAEIAGMVDVGSADVDLSDYYTKDEVATLGYQTEAQVIALINEYASGEPLPAAEGVEF